MERRRVDVGGAELDVALAGDGPITVIFENGLVTALEEWDAVVPAVAGRARTVRYEHRQPSPSARMASRRVARERASRAGRSRRRRDRRDCRRTRRRRGQPPAFRGPADERRADSLREAVRVANVGIFDHDHRSGVIYWSPEMYEIYGWDPGEPVRFNPRSELDPGTWAVIHPDDRARVTVALEQAHTGGDGRFDIDYRIHHDDGSVRWVTTRSQTFFEGTGTARSAVRTIGAVRDITAHKEAEQALRASEERLRQVTRVARIGPTVRSVRL